MTINTVTLIGGTGKLGPSIIEALVEAKITVTVLNRASSKSNYPSHIKVTTVSDAMDHDELVSALKGQDALVLAISGSSTAVSIKLADAALEAGIKRVIPADYGSCDSSDLHSLDTVPLYKEKKKVRDHLETLAARSNGTFSWTTLINGHFLDYGLKTSLLQIDLQNRKARVFDSGDVKWSATTLAGIALAVARILQHEEATKNKIIYVQSVLTSQNELLRTVESVMGGEKFEVEHVDSDDFVRENKEKLAKVEDQNDPDAIEGLVSVEGIVNGNWEGRNVFANELLGMPKVSLEDVVR